MHFRDQMYLIEPMWAVPAEEGRQSYGSHSDEAPHAVYHYQHLRKKRSSCSHGNTTTFYDHGARPSGLFNLGSLVKDTTNSNFCCFFLSPLSLSRNTKWAPSFFCVTQKSRGQTKEPTRKARTVELFVVVDHTEVRAAVFLLSDSLQMLPINHDAALFTLADRATFEAQFIYLNVLELILWFQYKKFGSIRTVEARVLEIANHVDKVGFGFLCQNRSSDFFGRDFDPKRKRMLWIKFCLK